jgi:general secretion pathway protein G
MKEKGKRVKGEEGKGEVRSEPSSPLTLLPFYPSSPSSSGGWTLIELVIVITVLTVLTLGVVPVVKLSVRRQKEQQLREVLRDMRESIDEFRRDTVGMQCTTAAAAGGGGGTNNQPLYVDPRSRVMLADCKIFGVDNPDRFPPDLQTLVEGVNVVPRANAMANMMGGTNTNERQATDNALLATKKKVYLREIPTDPITGERDWCFRSSYAAADEGCQSAPENIFDVRSKSDAQALNGEKYSDW